MGQKIGIFVNAQFEGHFTLAEFLVVFGDLVTILHENFQTEFFFDIAFVLFVVLDLEGKLSLSDLILDSSGFQVFS